MSEAEFKIGTDVIETYKRLSYTHWHAFAEFVDNATQSYYDNQSALGSAYLHEGSRLNVSILYDARAMTIEISDNAMGMSLSELNTALKVGARGHQNIGRSQYGLGMKTAAFWLGDQWSITTTKLGEKTEYYVVIESQKIIAGNVKIQIIEREVDPKLHYTKVKISKLHQKILGRRISNIKSFLSSMYRIDTRNKDLTLRFQNESLDWNDEGKYLEVRPGSFALTDFEFKINNKTVKGRLGVLAPGRLNRGRAKAGFSVFRFNRMIMGHPDAYRPRSIFGQYQGTNDLINQRIAGELYVDAFDVSHTKDSVLWTSEEEDFLEEKLEEIAKPYIKMANDDDDPISDDHLKSFIKADAIEEVNQELKSDEFSEAVEDIDIDVPDEIIEKAKQTNLERLKTEEPSIQFEIAQMKVKVFIDDRLSLNDPYYSYKPLEGEFIVIINGSHPHVANLTTRDSYANYIRYCIYDALTEYKVFESSIKPTSNRILEVKDRFMRVQYKIIKNTIEKGRWKN